MNLPKNASPIRKISKEDLETLVKESESFTSILHKLGLPTVGNSSQSLRKRLIKENINYDHILNNFKQRKGNIDKQQLPLEEYLVEGRLQTSRTGLKKRLIKEGLLINICSNCGLDSWLGNPISLDIHHINGINHDNRLENLCLLCPNCHRQTETFGGKNCKIK